jgi:5-methylcytosine-specific restriction protein A
MTRGVVSDTWKRDELKAAVDAYFEMQRTQRSGQKYVKKRYYEDLSRRFGRTEKAYERRMMNISYVMTLMGRQWLNGLKPLRNVGTNTAALIETLIAEAEGRNPLPLAGFEAEARKLATEKKIGRPRGIQQPVVATSAVTQYQRDPAVKAWVLQEAGGKCEGCGNPAPFKGPDGLPFLEVHHVRQLADQGTDTVTNAVALCPNCHRKAHYGADPHLMVARLYERVVRLVKE